MIEGGWQISVQWETLECKRTQAHRNSTVYVCLIQCEALGATCALVLGIYLPNEFLRTCWNSGRFKRCLQKAVIFTKRSPTWHECCRSCDVWIAWLGQIEWRNMPIWKTHHKNAQNDLCKQIFLILHSISVCWLSSNWQRLAYQLYRGLEPDISWHFHVCSSNDLIKYK